MWDVKGSCPLLCKAKDQYYNADPNTCLRNHNPEDCTNCFEGLSVRINSLYPDMVESTKASTLVLDSDLDCLLESSAGTCFCLTK